MEFLPESLAFAHGCEALASADRYRDDNRGWLEYFGWTRLIIKHGSMENINFGMMLAAIVAALLVSILLVDQHQ